MCGSYRPVKPLHPHAKLNAAIWGAWIPPLFPGNPATHFCASVTRFACLRLMDGKREVIDVTSTPEQRLA